MVFVGGPSDGAVVDIREPFPPVWRTMSVAKNNIVFLLEPEGPEIARPDAIEQLYVLRVSRSGRPYYVEIGLSTRLQT